MTETTGAERAAANRSQDTGRDHLADLATPPVYDSNPLQMANAMGVDHHATVEVEVAGNDTPQRWSGASWNDHMVRAERAGEPLDAQVIHVYPAWGEQQRQAEVEAAWAERDAQLSGQDGWAR